MKNLIATTKACIQKDDLEVLMPILDKYNPQVILEIGTHKGGSYKLFKDSYKPKKLITIDNTELAKIDSPYYIVADSHNDLTAHMVFKMLDGDEVDMLFIDGDHSDAGVRKDFELYQPFVKKGGLIVFHDVIYDSPPANEVYKLWKELKKHYAYIEFALNNNTTGVGIIFNNKFDRTEYGRAT